MPLSDDEYPEDILDADECCEDAPENEFREAFLRHRVILLTQDINAKTANAVKEDIARLLLADTAQPIYLYINCGGGLLRDGLILCDFMLLVQALFSVEMIGVVCGRCESMALAVLESCTKRFATPHSVFHFHPVWARCTVSTSRATAQHTEIAIQKLKKEQFQAIRAFCRFPNVSHKTICQLVYKNGDGGNDIFADDALRLNLLDAVLSDISAVPPHSPQHMFTHYLKK